jgi:phosphoglycolate phosphatase
MTGGPRLVIFDVDGTLVDSQGDIIAAMSMAFAALNLDPPGRDAVLAIVGLSLDQAMLRLAPHQSAQDRAFLVEAYKDSYMTLRAQVGAAQSSPMYPRARAALETLAQRGDVVLGVATGKSRRGLDKVIEAHGLETFFTTCQVADFHPSKPHPSMILQAMGETGVAAADTVMIGDTSFDMDMAHAAGVGALGVSWGYHPIQDLHRAEKIIDDYDELPAALSYFWSKHP